MDRQVIDRQVIDRQVIDRQVVSHPFTQNQGTYKLFAKLPSVRKGKFPELGAR